MTKPTFIEHPFRHWVIDDYLPSQLAQGIFLELTQIKDFSQFYSYENHFESKLAQDKWEHFPFKIKGFLGHALTNPFINFLEGLTGIGGLIGDHSYRGGGIHIHKYKGKLDPHLDFTMHEKLKLIRRLNVLIYFNKNYTDSWGGKLGLYEKDTMKCAVEIQPSFNKMVIFETPNAPHGLSSEWIAPMGITRKSLSMYFYTSPTADDIQKTHLSTQFLKKPGEITSQIVEELRAKRNLGRLKSNI